MDWVHRLSIVVVMAWYLWEDNKKSVRIRFISLYSIFLSIVLKFICNDLKFIYEIKCFFFIYGIRKCFIKLCCNLIYIMQIIWYFAY
jgi:hypothetical protein